MRVTLRAVKGSDIRDRLKRVTLEAENENDQKELVRLVASIKDGDLDDLPVVEADIMKWANQQS
jgi:ADP-dependent phosphofructokinase/glucokinase